jgi:predicted Zn-dependent protease
MSMKLVALASCALLFLAACSPGATPEARLARAGELAAAADYSKAQVELNKLIADGQESAQARRLLAHVSYAQGDLNAVEHNLERAKALGATGEDLIGLRARAYLATGRYDEALTFVTNAGASLNADESRYLRAEALIGSRDFTRALALLGAAEPSQVAQQTRARGLRARAYAGAGDLKNARQELDALLAAEPGQPEASLMLAELSLREQDAQHASKALEAALAARPVSGADPWRSRLLRMQAEIDLSIGQLDAARKTLADLKRTDPGARGTHVLAARMAVLDGNSRDAVAELRRLLLEQPEDSYVRLLLAVALVESRNYNQAEQQLSAILSKSPTTPRRACAARLQLMQGRLDGAGVTRRGRGRPEKSSCWADCSPRRQRHGHRSAAREPRREARRPRARARSRGGIPVRRRCPAGVGRARQSHLGQQGPAGPAAASAIPRASARERHQRRSLHRRHGEQAAGRYPAALARRRRIHEQPRQADGRPSASSGGAPPCAHGHARAHGARASGIGHRRFRCLAGGVHERAEGREGQRERDFRARVVGCAAGRHR